MGRSLYLTKAVISNFRSIKYLTLKNIGDITILIGANESGKSNILLALNWFGNDEPLSYNDKPLGKDIRNDEIIVKALFKVIDLSNFKSQLFNLMSENLGIHFDKKVLNFEGINNIKFLRIRKYADGSFKFLMLDKDLKVLNEIILKYFLENLSKNIKLIPLFEDVFIEKFGAKLKSNNLIGGDLKELSRKIKSIIRKNNVILKDLSLVNEKLEVIERDIKKAEIDVVAILKKVIPPLLNAVPSNVTISVDGKSGNVPLRDVFVQANNEMIKRLFEMKKVDYELLLHNCLLQIKPRFVFLGDEMELKGEIKKSGSWKDTLKEENREYMINSRFFSILGIDLEKFDKMELKDQVFELDNKLLEFSNKLKNLWGQLKLRFRSNVTSESIVLEIGEIGKDCYEARTTPPEMRSRGFKWYLAYLITLEYLGQKENTILLLDDPAVFLHEKGQKDFLKTLEEVSKKAQIIYSTHLISLFDEKNLDRILLVKRDKENESDTIVNRPWSNKIENIMAPVYHSLGVDKLIFENIKNVLFVEGVSDKFVFEGLQEIDEKLSKWYIHPIFGGDNVGENNEIIKKIKFLKSLNEYINDFEYEFVLDGDKREKLKKELEENEGKEGEKDKKDNDYKDLVNKCIFLGNNEQEMEDLIDKNFYLDSVFETYKYIFDNSPEKLRKLENIINNLKKQEIESHITKKLNEEFNKNDLGGFSKVDVSIIIKRKLKQGEVRKSYFNKILKELDSINKTKKS